MALPPPSATANRPSPSHAAEETPFVIVMAVISFKPGIVHTRNPSGPDETTRLPSVEQERTFTTPVCIAEPAVFPVANSQQTRTPLLPAPMSHLPLELPSRVSTAFVAANSAFLARAACRHNFTSR